MTNVKNTGQGRTRERRSRRRSGYRERAELTTAPVSGKARAAARGSARRRYCPLSVRSGENQRKRLSHPSSTIEQKVVSPDARAPGFFLRAMPSR